MSVILFCSDAQEKTDYVYDSRGRLDRITYPNGNKDQYYDPMLGRFISVDPFNRYLDQPESQNRYVYGGNNPISYTDLSGLDLYQSATMASQWATGTGPAHQTFDFRTWY